MDLKDVIVLKSGDYSVVMQDKYVLASTKMPSYISALIFNKGELSGQPHSSVAGLPKDAPQSVHKEW